MKKFLFLLCSLLAAVGAWAGTVDVNTTPNEDAFNDNASVFYIGFQTPGTASETYALSGFSVYENSGYGASASYAAIASEAPSSATSWKLSENQVLGVSNENTLPTGAGFVDYTLAASIQVKGGTTYYVAFVNANAAEAGVFTVSAQRVRFISQTTYGPKVCLGNGAVREDLTPGFKATFTEVGGGNQDPIYIETDVTSSFAALTKNTNWQKGGGGTAGYTATNFCPAVTTNAGQTVQVCEAYEGNCDRTGDILYQTVTGLAPGVYQIELYGAAAYTFGRGFNSAAFSEGTWTAGQSINENTGVTLYAETSEDTYGGEIPIYYATDFPNGAATVNLNNVVVGSNGQVKIGMSKTSKSTNWHVIQLKGVTAKVLASDALAAALAQAKAVDQATVPAGVYSELQTAVAAADKNLSTADEYVAVINAIEAALAKATKYAGAKAYFDKMAGVLDKTNVYTKEAYDAVYGTWLADYEAGTLADDVLSKLTADLAYSSGWHSNGNIDDVLLSAWTIGGEQAHEFDKALYINTWSVEGNDDGSDFRTPFFEYFVGDGESLGANTITGTLTGLTAGAEYEVSVFARARAKNGVEAADVTGITLSVGDGQAVDVTEGSTAERFNYATYKATGKVDANGNLTINFNVAADNNAHWLSFKDVMATKVGDAPLPEDPYEAAMATITEGKAYLISTKVGGKDYYMTTEGTLTADEYAAGAFVFSPESPEKDAFKPVGWYLGVNFTNPSTDDGTATGKFINEGYIRIYGEFRPDYECEVFFFDGEAYAIRSTNKFKGEAQASEWGANTFWTAIEGELPTAGYTLEQEYRWNLTEVNPNVQDLKNAIAAINQTVANKTGVGPYLFQKSEADLKTLADAAAAQKAVADNANATADQIQAAIAALAVAKAAYDKSGNLPKEGDKFTLKNKDGELYAGFEQTKDTKYTTELGGFSATPVELTWTAAEDGGYYITDGTHYYGFAENWNITINEAGKGSVKFEPVELEDGLYYIIHTPASEYRGSNPLMAGSNDKFDAGYRIFSDKKITDKAYWVITPNEAVAADPYDAALASIKNGANYSIFAEVNGQNYYLTGDGHLTANADDAFKFTFQAVEAANTLEPTGWNLGRKFTNPTLTNGSTGDIVPKGQIVVGSNDRNDWERQVFYLKDGKYAVRATNANSANWGANTYWTVITDAELPTADYALEPAYVWQLKENKTVDVACNLVEDGAVTATETLKMLVGAAPVAPASFNSDKFRGLYAFTPDVETVEEGTTVINFTPEWKAFKFSKSFDKANWYNMHIRSGWYVSKLETEPYYMNNAPTAEDKASEAYQWAFLPVEGEPFQVIVLNRASAGQSLTKVEAADAGKFDVVMRDGEYKWEIFGNGDGFVLREIGSENMWVNQDGGGKADCPLRFWNNSAGKTDGGSTFRVEFVEGPAEGTDYAGIMEQTLYAPGTGALMGTTTGATTVTLTPVDANHVNVTIPTFQLPMLPINIAEVTFENVEVQAAENGCTYAWAGESISTTNGQMVMTYKATLEGAQASADATPVFHFTVAQSWNDDIYFGADQAAIEAYKNAGLPDDSDALAEAIKAAQEALANTTTGIFQTSEAAAKTYAAAVQAAQAALKSGDKLAITAALEALNAATETFEAAPVQAPNTSYTYSIKNRNADVYLSLDAENNKVVLSATPTALQFEEAADGAWYITDGTSYVGLLGTNNWTMAAAADKKLAITPEAVTLEDGVYFLLKEIKGAIGTDALEPGSSCYADKNGAKNGYWTITRVILDEGEEESPYGYYGDELAEVDEEFGSDYYLYNIGTQQFLTGGNSWGTQASRNEVGTRFTVEALEDGTYTLDSHISNGGASHYLGSNGYVDAAAFGFTLTPVADDNEGVSIYTVGDGTNLLVANTENTVVNLAAGNAADPMAQWMLVSKSERLKKLAKATPQNPVDATFMILCSEFGRNDQYKNEWAGGPAIGGNNENMCAEKFNTNFDINQVVKYIPAGQYEVSVQGFYRAGGFAENTDAQNAFLYANGVETPLIAVATQGADAAGNGYSSQSSNGKFIPNSMGEASTVFSAGAYADNKLVTTVFDLTMKLGVKKDVTIANDWTIFDSFRIKYLGYDAATTLAAAVKALAEKVAEAEDVEETLDSENAALIDAAVKANNKTYNTSWEYAIAVNNIQDAIDKAKAAAGKEDKPIVTGIDAIFAEGNNDIYDLSGRKVSKAQKGIYIVNGKKVAVK